ncbi:LysM peptidoglycan-binding domain-containing protein [Calderihabitans maritimus]|uniref:Peptidoglycan-binding lysin domain-containing protein n=1 Tax=Calderihabitans maritimus TaxID=1246530 RepID=A0A1Z5HNV4_9FIRM|nr:LysM domain-containing protein [Calderihabitans maritimus]GAW91203.1 peptidoglycan-binding lysin domain-containing protein [Calderihabitans maritimus]
MVNNQRPPCPSGRYWKIRHGDTLYKIARQINSTVEAILRLNPGLDPRNLRIGQLICIPGSPPCPSGIYWVVSAGDTLQSIAQQVGTTVQRLIELNPGIDPDRLQIGQQICLPG